MLDKTEGIVLKTVKYSESSVIATIFTKKFGSLSFIVQGLRSSKNKQKGNLIQIGNILQLEIYLKEQRNLNRIKEYSTAYIYTNSNFIKQSILIFCIELISKCVKEHEVNERLYDYVSLFFIELDKDEHSIENKPLYFMLETASILGFEFSMQNILNGKYFNLERGKFEDVPTSTQSNLDEHETLLLKKLIAVYYEKNELKFNATERKILLEKLILYFRWHIPDFTDLKSPSILHEVLR
ncbi:MAG TPA: DNA repair protein RecO [Chitinophagales bacterium]|nr:DNA repair protein RecO [Chitinophagales bacterium]